MIGNDGSQFLDWAIFYVPIENFPPFVYCFYFFCCPCNKSHFLSRGNIELHHLCFSAKLFLVFTLLYRVNTFTDRIYYNLQHTVAINGLCTTDVHLCTRSTRPKRCECNYLLCTELSTKVNNDNIHSGFGLLCVKIWSVTAEYETIKVQMFSPNSTRLF